MPCFKRQFAVSAIIFGLSSAALAALYEDGPYVQGDIGLFHGSIDYLGFHQEGTESLILDIIGGYQWNRYFSTEAGLSRLQRVSGGSLNSVNVSAKASYPFSVENFDFTAFVKAGPSYYFHGDGNSSVSAQTALGGTVNKNEKTDYLVQLVNEPGKPFNYNGISFGMIYHFD